MINITKAEFEKYLAVTGKALQPVLRDRNNNALVILDGVIFWIFDYDYERNSDTAVS